MTQQTKCDPVGDRKSKPVTETKPKPKSKPTPIVRCRKTPDFFDGPVEPRAKSPARDRSKAGAKPSRTRK